MPESGSAHSAMEPEPGTPAERGSSMSTAQRWITLASAAVLVVAADQLSKMWAVKQLAPPPDGAGRVVEVVGSLRFAYAENTGMAFSQGSESGRWIGLVVIAVIGAMLFFASRVRSRLTVLLLGVVIGGALGNLIDRALRATDGWLSGPVVDFVDLQWWPVFNIADAAVVVGGVFLVFVATREPTGSEPDSGD
ncbi:MAG: signal peptidase II [Microthrixaceae bacterium]|nr:signal peptidase II [Microthrixaceae bacterium]